MKALTILISLTVCSYTLVSQNYLEQWYCDGFGNFEPFEYDESTNAFTVNLSVNCDPDHEGGFFYSDINNGTINGSDGADYTHTIENLEEGTPAHYVFIETPQLGSTVQDPNAVGWFGVKLNHDEFKGRVLLIIDDALLDSISSDIQDYVATMVGDGWKVTILTTNNDDTVLSVKEKIIDKYATYNDLRSLFIMGNVPVPYSGTQVGPDGHFQFRGAWMADSYYADLDGIWTDTEANTTSAMWTWHHNIPGDGKFDQDEIPSAIELEFGRVYFENLSNFEESREELYSRYLKKNIKYRRGGIVADNEYFLHVNSAAAPSSMHQSLNLINGSAPKDKKFTQIGNKVVLDHLPFESYHYASINGFGAPGGQNINGRVSSRDFIEDSMQVTFCALSASNIGNWGYDNNLLNTSVASKGNTVLSFWGLFALPLHYLYSGHTFGFCQKQLMITDPPFLYGHWDGFGDQGTSVTNSIFGDPTLKFFVHHAIEELTITSSAENSVILEWNDEAPDNKQIGYNIYRSNSLSGDFTKVNNDYIVGSTFNDEDPLIGSNVYSVRAVRLDSSMVSSYYTYSNGIIDSIAFELTPVDLDQDGFFSDVDCDDNNADVNPDQVEIPYNGLNDDCDETTLDDDLDQDGFLLVDDCDDDNPDVNPDQTESVYNGIDDDCNPETLDDDLDQDGFFLVDDCDDSNPNINPDADEIPNNGIDEDCDGVDLLTSTFELANTTINIYPNPAVELVNIDVNGDLNFQVKLYNVKGELIEIYQNIEIIEVGNITSGTYLLEIKDIDSGQKIVKRILISK